MAKVIALSNQKGGVGKTTTAYNFGAELGKRGYRVLLVDFDSQGNLTRSSGIAAGKNIDDIEETIATSSFFCAFFTSPLRVSTSSFTFLSSS